MSTRSTAFAVGIGSVAGALAALIGSPGVAPPDERSTPLKPIAQLTATAAPAAVAPALSVSTSAALAASATSAASTAPAAATGATAPASAASAAPSASVTPPSASAAPATAATSASLPLPSVPLPSTKAELLKIEMRCDQKDAAACELAAAAYDQGSAGVTDAAKAANYRKIGLTHWLSQCDKNSATACITLAGRYRAGVGVPQSERNADALIERSRELCKLNPAAACADLPKSAPP